MSVTRHLLVYVLLPVCVLAIAISFYRFMVAGDYVVEYEGECDPITESCFVGCEDEECSEIYYYSWVHKMAIDVQAQCGPNVLECPAANVCLPTDTNCSITYCSPDTLLEDETCEDLEASSVVEEETSVEEEAATEPEELEP